MNPEIEKLNQLIAEKSGWVDRLQDEAGKAIVGQKNMVERILLGLLADGHILLEGVPGLAKTKTVETISRALQTDFHRIQFTPDLLPADIVGTQIYDPKNGTFTPRKGPVFANIVLADEVNRAPAKVQSALLEAMQERQVTIGDNTFALPEPFLVLATQNPLEQEGTYPLPEAQVDRFMLKVQVTYPHRDEEKQILNLMSGEAVPAIEPVIDPAAIMDARAVVRQIYIDEKIKDYIVEIVLATRSPAAAGLSDMEDLIECGASPRATIFLALVAKAHAFLRKRGFVTPEDVKAVGYDVLRHRIILSYEAEAEEIGSEDIIRKIFDTVDVP